MGLIKTLLEETEALLAEKIKTKEKDIAEQEKDIRIINTTPSDFVYYGTIGGQVGTSALVAHWF